MSKGDLGMIIGGTIGLGISLATGANPVLAGLYTLGGTYIGHRLTDYHH